ncbi:MAG: asparagine synthase-related protein, partial [Candidatus Poribacteria bacterium]|nr:asparagine synthase-related protein [Candidatus Poribacteria bacterium]
SYLPENCLVKVDRSSMLASLEVRNPFLDYELVEYVLSLPGSVRLPSSRVHKELLKVVAKDIAPQFVIDRPKQGFDVPIGEWLRGPWKNWASDVVGLVGEMDIFRSSPIERMWLEHIQGKRDWTYQLWILIVFAIWDNKYSPDY